MLGAIIGDIVGSIYEFNNIHTKQFFFFSPDCFFTDDSVMTVAVVEALLKCKNKRDKLKSETVKQMQRYGKLYPDLSYGNTFKQWLHSKEPQAYNSFGNGAAMRVSGVAYFADSIEEVKTLSNEVTCVTHNHQEGLKGAEATAVAVWLAKNKKSKEEIKNYIEEHYYKLDFDYERLKGEYRFNETCQDTVPQAIYCFLISESFEDAIRTGVSIGGDSDTLCAITGAVAEAYYGVPENIKVSALNFLDKRLIKVYKKFEKALRK